MRKSLPDPKPMSVTSRASLLAMTMGNRTVGQLIDQCQMKMLEFGVPDPMTYVMTTAVDDSGYAFDVTLSAAVRPYTREEVQRREKMARLSEESDSAENGPAS